MKVLTFCAYYEPEIAASMYLTTDIFKGAANFGYDVELFAPTPTRGVSKETIVKYKKIKNEIRCDGRLIINRFSMMQEGTGTLDRAIRYILLNIAFVWKGIWTKSDIMFIDSTPPTQGFMAAFLKKIKRIPIIYNLQDIFPDSLVNAGLSTEKSIAFKIGRWMEKVTYRNADKIIVISDDFKRNIMAKGVPEEKIVVVPNWVNTENVFPVERKDNILFDRYNLDRDKFYICYSGNIGHSQNLELLEEVAKDIKDTLPDVRFVIIGDGAAKQELEEKVKSENIDNIIILPFQPYEEIQYVFSLGDVGLIMSKPGIGESSVPSKTWSIMAAERPILASFDKNSELSKLIDKVGCGIIADAVSKEEFIDAIKYFIENDSSNMGKLGREYLKTELDKDKCVGMYIKAIESVL